MENGPEDIDLELNGEKLKVQKRIIGTHVVYRVIYPGDRPPLLLTRALDANAGKFWTSVPEGRQPEADKIGPLIESYYKVN